jgi:hypothetical protein
MHTTQEILLVTYFIRHAGEKKNDSEGTEILHKSQPVTVSHVQKTRWLCPRFMNASSHQAQGRPAKEAGEP